VRPRWRSRRKMRQRWTLLSTTHSQIVW
jgi:hypothetical protein